MIAAGITLAAFPWGGDPASWYMLRFLNGWAGAMSLVPLETIVSRDSLPDRKTTNFAFYGVSLTVGGALGIAIGLNLYEPGNTLAFYLGGGVPSAAGLFLFRTVAMSEPERQRGASTNPALALGLGRNFLS